MNRKKTSMGRTFFRCASIGVAVGLVCFELVPLAQAVVPAPEGGYPGLNTAEGDDVLFSLTTGTLNTATGYQALYFNNSGEQNTAIGAVTLRQNTFGSGNTASGSGALQVNPCSNSNTGCGNLALGSNTGTSLQISGIWMTNGKHPKAKN